MTSTSRCTAVSTTRLQSVAFDRWATQGGDGPQVAGIVEAALAAVAGDHTVFARGSGDG
jgi:hypothetical protein